MRDVGSDQFPVRINMLHDRLVTFLVVREGVTDLLMTRILALQAKLLPGRLAFALRDEARIRDG
jgi:hypothetical protein